MSGYLIKTKFSAKKFYSSDRYSKAGRLLSDDGFMAILNKNERCYNITTVFTPVTYMVTMSVFSGIHCVCKEAIGMMCEYANKINDISVWGALKVDQRGYVYAQTDRSFKNAMLTKDDFSEMENACIGMFDVFGETLEKIAALKLLDSTETDPAEIVRRETRESFLRDMEETESDDGHFLFVDEDDDDIKISDDNDVMKGVSVDDAFENMLRSLEKQEKKEIPVRNFGLLDALKEELKEKDESQDSDDSDNENTTEG